MRPHRLGGAVDGPSTSPLDAAKCASCADVGPYSGHSIRGPSSRRRTTVEASALVATALVALDPRALLSEVVGLVESFEYTSIVRAHPDASFVVAHYHTAPRVIHFAGILGLWGAAIGLTWHVIRRR